VLASAVLVMYALSSVRRMARALGLGRKHDNAWREKLEKRGEQRPCDRTGAAGRQHFMLWQVFLDEPRA